MCLVSSLRKLVKNTNFLKIATNLILFSFKKRIVFKVKQNYIEAASDQCPSKI